jgi:hypothetical protein
VLVYGHSEIKGFLMDVVQLGMAFCVHVQHHTTFRGCAIAQAVSCWLRVQVRPHGICGGKAFSEYFSFPCHSFQQLLMRGTYKNRFSNPERKEFGKNPKNGNSLY